MWSAVKGTIFHDWQIITGGMNRGHMSQSLAVSNLMYILRNMQQRTESGVNLLITLKKSHNIVTL